MFNKYFHNHFHQPSNMETCKDLYLSPIVAKLAKDFIYFLVWTGLIGHSVILFNKKKSHIA